MTIQPYNTLTAKKEEFVPLNGKNVTMYVCGVTPYDEVHLGHARAYVTFDTIRRHLEHSGYNVKYIQNFTDVDDKIINRAAEKNISPSKLAETFINNYFIQMDKLGIRRADAYPMVTKTIPDIIKFIEALINKGSAYPVKSGDVYFAVNKFREYGKLSKRNIEEIKTVARVEAGEEKREPLDFALWKAAKPGEPEEVSWQSPWGKGRPGWHIECSVMSTNALGATIDIHGGGQDLIFPHHENEIAQSEAATGKPFAKYWIHNGFVTVNKEKMSKSLGNFFTLREIFEKYSPRVVRYFLLSQHYKSPLDFSDEGLKSAKSTLEGIDEVLHKLSLIPFTPEMPGHLRNLDSETDTKVIEEFNAAMNDDFNTEKALAVFHNLKREAASSLATKSPSILNKYYATLATLLSDNLGIPVAKQANIPQEALDAKSQREQARKNKEWKKSDELRVKLTTLGYKVEDNPDGSSTLLPL
jgi:cysteinyl-tRNA synthetase